MAQEDIIFYLDADGTAALNAIDAIIASLDALKAALEEVAASVDALTNLDKSLQDLVASTQAADAGAQQLATTLDQDAQSSTTASDAILQLNQALAALDDDLINTALESDVAAQAVDALAVSAGMTAQEADALSQALINEATADLNAVAASDALAAAADNVAAAMATEAEELALAEEMLLTAGDTAANFGVSEESLAQALDMTSAALQQQQASVIAVTDAWANLQAVMDHYFGSEAEVAAETEATTASMAAEGAMFSADAINLIILTTALSAAAGGFLQMGISAQDAIAHVIGLADPTLQEAQNAGVLAQYIQQLSSDSIQFGVSLDQAAQGLYHVISSGFQTADAMVILRLSMEASSATGAKMDQVSTALTSILKAYSLSASDAALITNQMTSAVVAGNQEFSTFVGIAGPLAAVAARTGVSFAEVAAAEATMTQINPRVRQDAQNLEHLMETLAYKTDKMAAAAQALGLNFDKTKFQSMDLIDKLTYLSQVAGGDTTAAFQALLTDQTSARAAFMVLSDAGNNYRKILEQIITSTNALDTAFQASEATITASLNHISAGLSVLAYQLIVLATPAAQAVLDGISNAIVFLSQHMEVLLPIAVALATTIAVLLVGSLFALIGFLGLILGPVATFSLVLGGLAGVGTAVAIVINQFGADILKIFPGLQDTWNLIRQIGVEISGAFTTAINGAGKAIQQFGAWVNQWITPPIITATNNIINFSNRLIADGITAVQKFTTDLKPFADFIAQNIVPQLSSFILWITNLAVTISQNLDPILQALKPILAALAIAFAPLATEAVLTSIAFLADLIPAIITAAGSFLGVLLPAIGTVLTGAIFPIIGAFVAANSVFILIGAAIAVIVAAFIALYNSSAPVRQVISAVILNFMNLWNILVAQLRPIWDQLVSTFNTQLVPAWQHFMTAIQPLIPVLQQIGMVIGGIIVAAVVILIAIIAGLINALAAIISGIVQFFGGVIQVISGIIQIIMAAIKIIIGAVTGDQKAVQQGWAQMWQGVLDIGSGIWNMIVGLFKTFIGAIVGFVSGFITSIVNFFQNLSNTLVGHSIIPDMITAIVTAFTTFFANIINAVQAWVAGIIAFFVNLYTTTVQKITLMVTQIAAIIATMITNILVAIKTFVTNVITSFTNLVTQAYNTINQLPAKIGGIFTALAKSALTWGADIVKNIASGIAGAIHFVTDAVGKVTAAISGALHFSKPDFGPLANSDQWMPDFGNMLSRTLSDQAGKVGTAAAKVASSIAMVAPTGSDLTGLSGSSSSSSNPVVQVLLAILSELQSQRNNRGTIGHSTPSTSIGTVNQQFGGTGGSSVGAGQMYQQLNVLAGLAQEYGDRGAIAGIGV